MKTSKDDLKAIYNKLESLDNTLSATVQLLKITNRQLEKKEQELKILQLLGGLSTN